MIDKIPAFLQAFEHVISIFTTVQSETCVSLLVMSLWDWAKTLKSFKGCQNIFGVFVIHILESLSVTLNTADGK